MIRLFKMFSGLTLVLNSCIIEKHLETGENAMYKEMYLHLFNAITDALGVLEKGNVWDAKRLLRAAQYAAEEMYISAESGGENRQIIAIFGETGESQ